MEEDLYNRAFDIVSAARVVIGDDGLSDEEMLPIFADFVAVLAMGIGGQETLQLTTERMLRLVEDCKSGKHRAQLH
jgi:hypothetical protein